jgi:cytolysin (calcineurin-like family phosphatase)
MKNVTSLLQEKIIDVIAVSQYLRAKKSALIFVLSFFFYVNSINAQGSVRIENVWKGTYLNNETGKLDLGAIQPGWNSAQWVLEPVPGTGYIRIKNVWKGTYLSNETGKLELGAIQPGWNSAMWVLEPVPGTVYKRIKNVWKGTYLNNETGKLELGAIQPGWSSAQWKVLNLDGTPFGNAGGASNNTPKTDNGFSMIFASDSQWPWTNKTDAGENEPENEKETNATTLNQNHVTSINSLVNSLGNVKGLIINGDLTAFGHSNELEKFKSIYANVKVPMYLGLGNHDYANNVDDTYENNCANRMVEYMVGHIKSNGSTSSDYNVSDSYVFPEYVTTTTGSLSYSWDVGNVHFVQLQNFPIYKREWSNYVSVGAAKRKTVKITSALNWLGADLAKARNAGKIIILNYHDSDEHWQDYGTTALDYARLSSKFISMLSTYKVAAVFVGHYHSSIGNSSVSRISYGSTPVFYCGSASQSKFLLVNFKGNKMTVQHVSSLNAATNMSNKKEYTVFDQPVSVPAPKQDGWVTFFNESGYVARYTMTYTLNGKVETFSTGNLATGNKIRYEIPADVTKVTVKGDGQTGLAWEPWRNTFYFEYNEVISKCFKSYGTTLNQKWTNGCE